MIKKYAVSVDKENAGKYNYSKGCITTKAILRIASAW